MFLVSDSLQGVDSQTPVVTLENHFLQGIYGTAEGDFKDFFVYLPRVLTIRFLLSQSTPESSSGHSLTTIYLALHIKLYAHDTRTRYFTLQSHQNYGSSTHCLGLSIWRGNNNNNNVPRLDPHLWQRLLTAPPIFFSTSAAFPTLALTCIL